MDSERDECSNPPIRDVTTAEMLEAMGRRGDDEVFRYFQTSVVNARGEPVATDTLRLTFGQLRRDLLRERLVDSPDGDPHA